MHILWLAPQLFTFLADELQALQKLGIRTTLIVSSLPEQHAELAKQYNLDVRVSLPSGKPPFVYAKRFRGAVAALKHIPLPRNRYELRYFYRIVKHAEFIRDFLLREKVDVIHSHFAWPDGDAGLFGSRGLGIPLFLTLRGVDILVDESTDYGLIRDAYYRKLLTGALHDAEWISVASQMTMDAVKQFAPQVSNVSILPNSLDTEKFRIRQVDRKALFPGRAVDGHFIIVTVGNLTPRKRFDLSIEAFAQLQEKHPDSLLAIVGGGKPPYEAYATQLKMQAQQRGVEDKVVFAGHVSHEQVVSYINAADVLAISSNTEGFGNTMLEAMACAKPVVSTKVGGMLDVIKDGNTGYLVDQGDSRAIAGHLIHLAENPVFAKEMGLAGYKKLMENFTLDKRAEGFLNIYRQLSDTCR